VTPPPLLEAGWSKGLQDGGRYLSGNANLFLRGWTSLSGLTLGIRGRLLLPDGTISQFEDGVALPSTRARTVKILPHLEGILLSFSLTVAGANPRRGQCFVQVGVTGGEAIPVNERAIMFSGYVIGNAPTGWPETMIRHSVEGPGMLRSVAGSNPAPGAEISETVPTDARWRLRGMSAQLVTDATPATRQVYLVVDDGTTELLRFPANATQTASLTRDYRVLAIGTAPAAVSRYIFVAIGRPLDLFQGWRIGTATENLAAGDDWGAPRLYVEEWIEE